MRICPHCNQMHPSNTQFCPITGQALSEPALVCPNCKNDVQVEWKHCPYCQANLYSGKSIEDEYVQPTSLRRRKCLKKRWIMIGIVVLVLSILTIGVGYLLWINNLLDSDTLADLLSSPTAVSTSLPVVVEIPRSRDTESLIEASSTATATEAVEITATVTETLIQATATQTPTRTPTRTPTPSPTTEPTRGPWLACPGTYLSQIQVGDQSYIGFNPPVPNRVRSGPGTNFSIIGSLQNGEQVTVLDGPACADRWVWWIVRSNATGLTGWTAEGDFENYWLIPLP
jgi:RNA polymerase subunit RPABC4/transcription elongation factor Spt4